MIFTPCELDVLLHCYCICDHHPRKEAPAVAKAYRKLFDMGLIEPHETETYYRTTELGTAHVRQIRALPLPTPIKVYADSNGDIIK